jgi:hypothetical protein
MLTEPVRSASKELFPPKAGEGFDGVREIKARTRAFLAKLVASSAVLVTLVAAGNAVVTRQYGMLSVIWSIAGPFLAGIMVYHFASSAREEVEREAILWRRSEISAQPGDSASAQALARVEVDFRHALTRGRRLDRIMAAVPQGEAGRKLHKRMLANRAHLFVFMTNRAVPCTNNVSERHVRPSVILGSRPWTCLPQGDQRLPLRVGGGNLCRLPLRR